VSFSAGVVYEREMFCFQPTRTRKATVAAHPTSLQTKQRRNVSREMAVMLNYDMNIAMEYSRGNGEGEGCQIR